MSKPAFSLSKGKVKFLCLALAADSSRPILQLATLRHIGGQAVIATTDTYRIHAVYLGLSREFDPITVDIARVRNEMDFLREGIGIFDAEAGTVSIEGHQVHAPVFATTTMKCPSVEKFLAEEGKPVERFYAFNSRYLADMASVSCEDAYKVVMTTTAGGSVTFQPEERPAAWKAVIMPMSLQGWEVQP